MRFIHIGYGVAASNVLSKQYCGGYLLRCNRSHRALLQNIDSSVQAERALELEDNREKVIEVLCFLITLALLKARWSVPALYQEITLSFPLLLVS